MAKQRHGSILIVKSVRNREQTVRRTLPEAGSRRYLDRMRPAILTPLFASVTSLGGIGPKTLLAYDRLISAPDGARVVDLIFHTPVGIIDRRSMPGIAKAAEGATVTIDARIDRHRPPPPASRQPYKVFAQDDTGEIALVFFRAKADYLLKTLPVGERRFISGRVEWFNGQPQMAHPDLILTPEDFERAAPVEPVYPLTEGLTGRMLAKSIAASLDKLPDLPEWQDPRPGGQNATGPASTRLSGPCTARPS